jgi:hypothetical protein
VKVDISQLKQAGINWIYCNVVEERAVEIQSLMFMATLIVQRPSIYVLLAENEPEKPDTVRVLQEKLDNKDIEKLALSQFWIIGGQHSVQVCRQFLKAHSDRTVTLTEREVKSLKSHEITVVWSLDQITVRFLSKCLNTKTRTVEAGEHLFDIMMAARNLWVSHGFPLPTSWKSVEGPYGVSFHFPRPNHVSDGEHSVSP